MKDVFGAQTYSKYMEPKLKPVLGDDSTRMAERWTPESYVRAMIQPCWVFIKTHDLPFDGSPFIY